MFYPKWKIEFNVTDRVPHSPDFIPAEQFNSVDSKLDTQIALVYTAILSGGQIGGIISGFLGHGFYICSHKPDHETMGALRPGPRIPEFNRWLDCRKSDKKNVGQTNRFLR